MDNKSSKKSKIYFIIAQVLFWYSVFYAITTPLVKSKYNFLFTLLSGISGAIVLNPLFYICLALFWRSAKNLSQEELNKRNYWSKCFPKYVVIIFVLGITVTLILLIAPFLIPRNM
jgi:glucose-6-phosphate-specific signal transduction histidine kinase